MPGSNLLDRVRWSDVACAALIIYRQGVALIAIGVPDAVQVEGCLEYTARLSNRWEFASDLRVFFHGRGPPDERRRWVR